MKIQDLKKLMGSLSLHEKIGQLVQLDGGFFGAEEVPTGPCDEMGIAPWVVENAGSVLNVLGVNKVQEVQQHHLQHIRIPLLFMADVVYTEMIPGISIRYNDRYRHIRFRHCCSRPCGASGLAD